MADSPLLGPDGKFNPQKMSANVSIDTTAAEKTFAHLQKFLEGSAKSFGTAFDAATGELSKPLERLYSLIGDKESVRRSQIIRYKNEAIAAIEAETKANIAGIEEAARAGKMAHDQAEREKTALTSKAIAERESIEKKTAKKLAQDAGIGGVIRNKSAEIGGMIGGPAGSVISSAGSLLANPYALGAMAVFEAFKTKAAFTSTGAELAGSGFKLGSGAGVGLNFATNLFNGGSMFGPAGSLGQALSADQQRAIIGQMAQSRTMIGETRQTGGFEAVRNNLGLFANILPDAAKDMEIMTDATKNLNMSQKDITATFVSSRVNADKLKITQLDAIKAQMDMAKALRNITNDGAVAASTLYNISGYLNSIGASEAEKARIGGAVGQAGANLTLPQIAGMFAFTHGGKIPGPGDLFGDGKMMGNNGTGPFQLMGEFLTKVGHQFKDPTQRMFAANSLQTQFLPGLRLQDTPKFFELTQQMMNGGISSKEFGKQFQALESKTPQVAMAEGIAELREIVDPIKRLENVFSNFWVMVDDKINKIFQSIGKAMPFNIFKGLGNVDKNILHKPDGSHPATRVSDHWK